MQGGGDDEARLNGGRPPARLEREFGDHTHVVLRQPWVCGKDGATNAGNIVIPRSDGEAPTSECDSGKTSGVLDHNTDLSQVTCRRWPKLRHDRQVCVAVLLVEVATQQDGLRATRTQQSMPLLQRGFDNALPLWLVFLCSGVFPQSKRIEGEGVLQSWVLRKHSASNVVERGSLDRVELLG